MGVRIKGHAKLAFYKWSGEKIDRDPPEDERARRKAAWKAAQQAPFVVRRAARKDKAAKVLNMPGPKPRGQG